MSRILIVEDDAGIVDYLTRGLRAEGYEVDTAEDGLTAYEKATLSNYNLIIMDLGLPMVDGLDLLSRLRSKGVNVPVIVLSARTSVQDRVGSLEGGANDYMPKPFQFAELLARVRLRLGDNVRSEPAAQLTYNDLTLDLRTHQVTINDRSIDLTRRELGLLETLMRHPGQILSRTQLHSYVWGMDFDPGSNVVDVYIRSLRKKIGAERVETVRGSGYRLR